MSFRKVQWTILLELMLFRGLSLANGENLVILFVRAEIGSDVHLLLTLVHDVASAISTEWLSCVSPSAYCLHTEFFSIIVNSEPLLVPIL